MSLELVKLVKEPHYLKLPFCTSTARRDIFNSIRFELSSIFRTWTDLHAATVEALLAVPDRGIPGEEVLPF